MEDNETSNRMSMEEVVTTMTYNEMERVEKLAGGVPFGELFARFDRVSITALKALGYVWACRSEPELKMKDFGERPALSSWSEFAVNEKAVPADEEVEEVNPA